MGSSAPRLRGITRRVTSTLVPKRVRARLADVPVAQRFAGRRIVDPDAADTTARLKARERWQSTEPEVGLTWGLQLSGTAFISKLTEHAPSTDSTRLLEIGPGYGRLVESLLDARLPFASYVGFDLSEKNVAYLGDQFDDPRLSFVVGNAEEMPIPEFDVGYSSLTFKHLYPSFETAMVHAGGSLAPGGRFVFDVIEGSTSFFEHDEQTFVRRYQRAEISEILERAGLAVAAWDVVKHDDDVRHDRLLVVASRRDERSP